MRTQSFIGILFLLATTPLVARLKVVWPTEHPPVDMGESYFSLLQPTASGEIQSGNFGCVRSNENQFHEGMDLRSFSRNSRGEATDAVRSVLPGVVVYTNNHSGKSSYGRYVVIEHSDGEMYFLSLYAHLSAIERGIARGQTVASGQKIATMGRSASYTIPKDRAHLHFEVCLRLTDNFQSWYAWKKFPAKNDHGVYNGMNLVGINPITFFEETQWNNASRFSQVLHAEKTAFTVVVSTTKTPDFIRRYPALVAGIVPEEGLAGWQIEYTWYGVPKRWTPLLSSGGRIQEGKLALKDYDQGILASDGCRDMIRLRHGEPSIGPGLQTSLQLLFGFR